MNSSIETMSRALLNRRREMMQQGGVSILPSEYQQVAYIETDGNQKILTNIRPGRSDDIIKCECEVLRLRTGDMNNNMYYSRGANQGGAYAPGFSSYSNLGMTVGVTNGPSSFAININSYGPKYILEVHGNGTFWVNGVELSCQRPDYFWGNAQFVLLENMIGRMSHFELVNIADVYSCFRKSDNKPGMYDIINDVFYINDGTGEFILGPNV